jgi:transposase
MRHRHAISDDNWERIKDLLPGQAGQAGVTAKDNRLFIDAVLWIAKTGAPWRDLPDRFGNWNSVWKRFDRWARKGRWEKIFEALQDPDLEWLLLDSTVIRAHQHAAGAEKKGTGPVAKTSRHSAAVGEASAPRSTRPSTGWDCLSGSS